MKKRIITALLILCSLTGCSEIEDKVSPQKTAWEAAAANTAVAKTTAVTSTSLSAASASSSLSPTEDIDLHDTDGDGTNYVFTYKGEEFSAVYTPDNWRIADSFKITDKKDITVICRALTAIHPIPTKDRKSYRTAESLAYEWQEHNSAYQMLPDDSQWKDTVKDVDLDPDDEGKSLMDMAFDRLNEQNGTVK